MGVEKILKEKGMQADDIFKEMYQMEMLDVIGHYEIREHNINILESQILNLFEHVHAMGGQNPYPKPIYKVKEEDNETIKLALQRISAHDIDTFSPSEELIHPDGFSMVIKKSRIDHPESGYGVYIQGEVIPGTVLGFYPGVVYFPNNIKKEVLEGNEYMYCRYDNTIVDGYQWDKRSAKMKKDQKILEYVGAIQQEQNDSIKKFRNTYGIINYVNHPPKGIQPNVMCYSYDFPESFPDSFKPYIPNEYFENPGFFHERAECHMTAVVCVAKRHIKDEELFLNYRYNPNNPYPDWYEQPDEEEAKRRWTGYI